MRLINQLFILAFVLFVVQKAVDHTNSATDELINIKSEAVKININIPDIQLAKENLILMPLEGKWYYQEEPFSGYAIDKHPNGKLAERIGYWEGKKEGVAKKWYDDGLLQKQSFYIANRLDGTLKIWSANPNSILIVESNYSNGKKHGVQRRWYPNGQLFRQTNIYQGKEQGLQQAWRKSGKQYVNYEAKNGRIFGLKQTSLCYELDDENIQYNK